MVSRPASGFLLDTVDSAYSRSVNQHVSLSLLYKRSATENKYAFQPCKDKCCTLAGSQPGGGNDELIFDGSSTVFDENGVLTHLASHFEEDLLIYDTQHNYQPANIPQRISPGCIVPDSGGLGLLT